MLKRLLCRLGKHPGVRISNCVVFCGHCGAVIDRLDPDIEYERIVRSGI